MNVYVYPTDSDWYAFLSRQVDLDEVNFWRPGGQQPFRRLDPGDVLMFRLRAPHNAIGGGGIYTHFSLAPLAQVWEAFQTKNGAPDYESLLRLIARHKDLPLEHAATSIIGCIVLSSPFFLPRDRWIPVPADYPVHSPQGQRYDAASGTGKRLLEAVAEALASLRPRAVAEPTLATEPMNAMVEFRQTLTRRRLGQGAFSLLVADAYNKRCAITGERTYPVLEASHIRPITRGGLHRVDNGLLLRSDIHKLFDRGYATITPDGEFRVSQSLDEEWHNGRIYYALDKHRVRRPIADDFAPAREFLEWHRETVFKG